MGGFARSARSWTHMQECAVESKREKKRTGVAGKVPSGCIGSLAALFGSWEQNS